MANQAGEQSPWHRVPPRSELEGILGEKSRRGGGELWRWAQVISGKFDATVLKSSENWRASHDDLGFPIPRSRRSRRSSRNGNLVRSIRHVQKTGQRYHIRGSGG